MSSWWSRRDVLTAQEGLALRGYMYLADVERSLANGASASAQFVTGSVGAVLRGLEFASAGEDVRAYLWEATSTGSVSGSARGVNLNQTVTGAGSVSGAVVSSSVLAGSVSTMLVRELVPAGHKGGAVTSHGEPRVLKASTTYLLEVVNLGSSSTIFQAHLMWSENEPSPYAVVA